MRHNLINLLQAQSNK